MSDWTQAKVVGKQLWTPRLISLQFDAELPPFLAGQFARVGLDIDGERVGRPYSFVNAPDERPYELYFNIVDDGNLTSHLAALEPGDTLWVLPEVFGFLVLDEIPDAERLWLFSSGTGIGPFLSMLKTDEIWQRFGHVVLCHGVRYAADLSYQELIEGIGRARPGQLSYIPLVTRDEVPDALNCRIPAAIDNGLLEQRVGFTLDSEHSHVMLCGNSGMIDDTIKLLEQRGMRRHRRREPGHISSEQYF
jgi:ferredoxin--NADP+ reductase